MTDMIGTPIVEPAPAPTPFEMTDPNLDTQAQMELRFTLEPVDSKKLAAMPWVRAAQVGRAVTRVLNATYFDTADRLLHGAGLTLRVRKEGRHFVQCVKAGGPDSDGPFARDGIETAISSPEPALSRLLTVSTIGPLLGRHRDAVLAPVFETRIRRTTRRLELAGGTVAQLDVDSGEIICGEVSSPVHEVELKLLEGAPQAYFEVARQLVTDLGGQVQHRSKSDRGFQLLTGNDTVWRKAGKVPLNEKHTVEEALAITAKRCIAHMLDNEACVLADAHPEGVHQMRVALRRFRSALNIYKKLLPLEQYQALNGRLKALLSSMGPARDLDVFGAEIVAPPAEWRPTDGNLMRLLDVAEAARLEAYDNMRAYIQAAEYSLLLIDLLEWIECRLWRNQPVSENSAQLFMTAADFASGVIEKRHKSLRKAGRHLEQMSAEERHALRINIKKVRYSAEFFATLFIEKRVKRYTETLSGLQDYLGLLNDIAVADILVHDLAETADGPDRLSLTRAGGVIAGWYSHAAMEHERDLFVAWDDFLRVQPFWR